MCTVASSRLNHCNPFSHYCGSFGKENKNQNEIVDLLIRCGTSTMLSDTANSLVTDENTGKRQIWLIKPMITSRAEF